MKNIALICFTCILSLVFLSNGTSDSVHSELKSIEVSGSSIEILHDRGIRTKCTPNDWFEPICGQRNIPSACENITTMEQISLMCSPTACPTTVKNAGLKCVGDLEKDHWLIVQSFINGRFSQSRCACGNN